MTYNTINIHTTEATRSEIYEELSTCFQFLTHSELRKAAHTLSKGNHYYNVRANLKITLTTGHAPR